MPVASSIIMQQSANEGPSGETSFSSYLGSVNVNTNMSNISTSGMSAHAAAALMGLAPGDDIPNDPGKMFIGGLSWQTTPESIREYFSSFGELAEVMVMKDPATRRSRGFGFITFSESHAVDQVLKYPVHQLDGKLVEPKVAVPRKTNPKLVMRTRKIFVGGLSATTSLEDIKNYFEQFSKVKEAMLAFDKVTNRHRGFGFVTFDNEDVVDKICEIHFHEINGKMVESKKALPKEPRLGYYNGYGPGPMPFGPFSPPGHVRYPAGMYGPGGHYPYGGGPRGYGVPAHYGGYPHPYSGYDRDHWMHEQYGGPNYNSTYYNGHRPVINSNAHSHLDNSFSSGGGTYGYDHNTEMKYYHSSPQQDNKYNSSTEDRRNGNTSNLMPGSYGQRMKGSSDEIASHLEVSLNNTSFNNRFNNSLEDSFHRDQHNKRTHPVILNQAVDSNQQNTSNDGSYEAYLREGSKYMNGHNFSSEGGNHNNQSSGNIAGGNFNNLGYSPARSLHGNSFGSMNRRQQLYDSPTNALYSTSAGSGGSGENSGSSHGYEDDFPELTSVGSKFNNLRLDTDHIEAQNSGNHASLVGNTINTIAETHANEISTIQQLKQALNNQSPTTNLGHSNGGIAAMAMYH